MKIQVDKDYYKFKEALSNDSIQVDNYFTLEKDNGIINLGCLSYQNNQYDYNYNIDSNLFAFYSDASSGIIEFLHEKLFISSYKNHCYDYNHLLYKNYLIKAKKDLKEFIDEMDQDDLQDILQEINNTNKELSALVENDFKKLLKFLKRIGAAMIKNFPDFGKIENSRKIYFNYIN